MSTAEWADGLLVLGGPLLLLLLVSFATLTGKAVGTTLRSRERWMLLLAAMAVPALVWGTVGVFAAFVILNAVIGGIEFAPFSRYGMFSTLPDERRIVVLQTGDGTRVLPQMFSSVHPGDMQKHFAAARRGARANLPDADDDDLDGVAVHFVGELLRTRRQPLKGPPPDDLEIVVIRLWVHDGQVRDERRSSAHLRDLM